jgi:LPXTG-motif cell wall-anchored protein
MNKSAIAVALLVVGIALLIWAFNLYGGFDSKVSRALTGSSTDKAMWTLVGGAALTAVGAFMLFFKKK